METWRVCKSYIPDMKYRHSSLVVLLLLDLSHANHNSNSILHISVDGAPLVLWFLIICSMVVMTTITLGLFLCCLFQVCWKLSLDQVSKAVTIITHTSATIIINQPHVLYFCMSLFTNIQRSSIKTIFSSIFKNI